MNTIMYTVQELDAPAQLTPKGTNVVRSSTDGRPPIVRDKLVSRSDLQSLDLLIDIATRHYLHGSSQSEIARLLSLDPSTISRYLKRARDEGIVRIEIVQPRRANVEMARLLARELDLSRVLVAEVQGEDDDALTAVASVAAQFTSDQLRRGARIGIGWGETLAAVVRHLDSGAVEALQVAQLAGGLAEGRPGIQGHELVRQITEIYPLSRAAYLHAPSIVDSDAICAAFLADRSVQAALAFAAQSQVALVGIGGMEADATIFKASHILSADRDALVAQGAVGSMNARFYDATGRPVGHLDRRTVALAWSELAAIPTVIAVAAGGAKAAAIRGAAQTGAIDVLVTDERTAALLIEHAA
jgi:DNA-binding transcriptional regulator LsrR (DeoR family)